MNMTIDEALKNIHLTISEFRGTVSGQVLTGTEHLAVQTSFTVLVNELNRLQEVEKSYLAMAESKREEE